MQRWICQACGAQNMPQMGNCFRCGAAYQPPAPPQGDPTQYYGQGVAVTRPKSTGWMWIVAGAVLAALLLFGLVASRFVQVMVTPEVEVAWRARTFGVVRNLTTRSLQNVTITSEHAAVDQSRGFATGTSLREFRAIWGDPELTPAEYRAQAAAPGRGYGSPLNVAQSTSLEPTMGRDFLFGDASQIDASFPPRITVYEDGKPLRVRQILDPHWPH